MKRTSLSLRRRLLVAAAALAALGVTAATAWALPPFTLGGKASPPGPNGPAIAYRLSLSCGASFDRLVVRFRDAKPGYSVRYVPRVFRDPSGLPLPLRGSAKLLVVFRSAQAHTADGTVAYLPAVRTPLCGNLLQVKKAGDFEGVLSLGVGVDRKAGFRVFRLTSPTRVVIDIAH